MIRGSIRKYSDFLPGEFVGFLGLIDRANVEYIRNTNPSNVSHFSPDSFKFNASFSFQSALIDAFELATKGVKNYIAQNESKIEVLFSINELLTLVSTIKGFLSYENGQYVHLHVSYKSEEDYQDLGHLAKETDLQWHLRLIKEYSDMMFNFLESLRFIYLHMSEEEVAHSQHQQLFKILSTEKKPLQFLDYLMSDDWRQDLRWSLHENKISEESSKIDFSHDTEVLSFIEIDQTSGDDILYKIQFSDYLCEFIIFQIEHSYNAIDTYLSTSEDKFKSEDRIKNLLSKIEQFIIDFRKKENKASYELALNLMIDFANRLIKKYPHYLTQEDSPKLRFATLRLNEDINSSNSQDNDRKRSFSLPPRVYFKWNSTHPLPLTFFLFKGLVDNGFIKNDDFVGFSQLFSGKIESVNSPIRWNNNVKSKRGAVGLTNLLYLFNQLSIKDLFSSRFEENELEATIKSCFVSDGGKQIISFASARQENKRKLSSNNLTEQQIQINMIIEALLESNSQ